MLTFDKKLVAVRTEELGSYGRDNGKSSADMVDS